MKELRDWLDVGVKVVLALVGIVVGYFFSFQKQQNEDIKLIVDMATAEQSDKRIMGASIAQAYYDQKRIPQEVYLAVYTYANSTKDKRLQAVVNSGVAASSKEEPNLKQAVANATSNLPIRVYFHIRDEGDRDAAKAVEKQIESSLTPDGNAIIVPGIQLIVGSQSSSELRCFKKPECDTVGKQLVELFQQNGVTIALKDMSAAYKDSNSIRPNQFEAWFAPGLPPPAAG